MRSVLLLLAALTFTSLPSGVQRILEQKGIDPAGFPRFIESIEKETARRERDGENDHLIFFALQSRAFTGLPPIEPAESARAFQQSGRIPVDARRRLDAFLKGKPKGDRMIYLRGIVPKEDAVAYMEQEYRRMATALYRKEFAQDEQFYRGRGHSTDTSLTANYAVRTALDVLHALRPEKTIERVLIVGPGLDFAPRTGYDERFPPQSYQPYAVADSLLRVGLAKAPQIDCWDINPRVIRFLQTFSERPELHLFSMPGELPYRRYFKEIGYQIGEVRETGDWEKTITVRPEVARRVPAFRANIVTEAPATTYDLAIATNVLLYFEGPQLLLALANLSHALMPGGHLIHNEVRPEIDEYAAASELAPLQARSLRIASGARAPLYDAFALYEKAEPAKRNPRLDRGDTPK